MRRIVINGLTLLVGGARLEREQLLSDLLMDRQRRGLLTVLRMEYIPLFL